MTSQHVMNAIQGIVPPTEMIPPGEKSSVRSPVPPAQPLPVACPGCPSGLLVFRRGSTPSGSAPTVTVSFRQSFPRYLLGPPPGVQILHVRRKTSLRNHTSGETRAVVSLLALYRRWASEWLLLTLLLTSVRGSAPTRVLPLEDWAQAPFFTRGPAGVFPLPPQGTALRL